MRKRVIWILLSVIFVSGLGFLYQTVPSEDEIHTVSMINNEGVEIGTVQLSETKAGVLLSLDISGLTPEGEHATHIHETGDCTPLDSFKNSGGHFNPMNKAHGMKHDGGKHAGDMPNIKPNKKGVATLQILNPEVTLGETTATRASVFDADGSALVIHAGADDHVSQPSGAAGARIACGVIK